MVRSIRYNMIALAGSTNLKSLKNYDRKIITNLPHSGLTSPALFRIMTLEINYPLSNPYIGNIIISENEDKIREFKMKNLPHTIVYKQNFISYGQLAELIVTKYQEIYIEEDRTTQLPVQFIPGMFNRDTTDGTYGIWGHIIEDLLLTAVHIKNNKITLSVDS